MRFSFISLGLLAVLASVVTAASNEPGNKSSGDKSKLTPLNTNSDGSDTGSNRGDSSIGNSSPASSINSNADILAVFQGLSPEDQKRALSGAKKALKRKNKEPANVQNMAAAHKVIQDGGGLPTDEPGVTAPKSPKPKSPVKGKSPTG